MSRRDRVGRTIFSPGPPVRTVPDPRWWSCRVLGRACGVLLCRKGRDDRSIGQPFRVLVRVLRRRSDFRTVHSYWLSDTLQSGVLTVSTGRGSTTGSTHCLGDNRHSGPVGIAVGSILSTPGGQWFTKGTETLWVGVRCVSLHRLSSEIST